MQMHELIDREDPRCLYCQSECDFKLEHRPDIITLPPDTYYVEILTCIKCKEIFEIHGYEDELTKITKFVFTCKNIVVINQYPQPSGIMVGFNIGDKSNLWPKTFSGHKTINIPTFEVNFSDKKKLHKKLKTYLVFS